MEEELLVTRVGVGIKVQGSRKEGLGRYGGLKVWSYGGGVACCEGWGREKGARCRVHGRKRLGRYGGMEEELLVTRLG